MAFFLPFLLLVLVLLQKGGVVYAVAVNIPLVVNCIDITTKSTIIGHYMVDT